MQAVATIIMIKYCSLFYVLAIRFIQTTLDKHRKSESLTMLKKTVKPDLNQSAS